MSKNSRWLYLLILALVWGSSFILMKKALIGLTPIQVGALRIIITGIALMLVGFKSLSTIKKHHWWPLFLTALLGTFFPVFLFAYAVSVIDSSITSILNSLTPLNTLIVGFLIFGFTFKRHQVLGVCIGFIGTAILIFKGAEMNPNQNYLYAALPIISSIGYAFNVNIIKKSLSDLSAMAITAGNFVLIIIPAIVVLWFSNFFDTYESTKEMNDSLVHITILAILGTAFAKTLFNKLIQMSSPLFATSVTYLIPIVAVFWGLLDNENLTIIQLIAGIIILLGVYLANRK